MFDTKYSFILLLLVMLALAAESNAQNLPENDWINPDPEIELYEPDPLLVQAIEAYSDMTSPSSDSIELFERYAEENPESPFLAEVYFRIGALYSIHRRPDEPLQVNKQISYYQEARKRWGEEFSYLNQTAWGTIANRSDNLAERKAYYDWLISFESAPDITRVHSIREIEQVFNGRQPEITDDDKTRVISAWTRANLPGVIHTSEQNILYWSRNNYDYLVDLSSTYPNRRLGQKAKEQLKKLDLQNDVTSPSAILNSKDFLDPIKTSSLDDPKVNVVDADVSPDGIQVSESEEDKNSSLLVWIGVPSIITVSFIVIFLYRKRTSPIG